MNIWIHTAILATTLTATIAVGIAAANQTGYSAEETAKKADRLPVVAMVDNYKTVEIRGDGVSVLQRVPLN